MPELTDADIRTHLEGLAVPPTGLGDLRPVAARLCEIQRSLTPVTTPRRLVLFAADHGHGDESNIAVAIREVASGGSASAVLARTTGTDLVLVDVGSRSDPFQETPNYRVRKVRAGTRDFTLEPALTASEFRTAFDVGRTEAELAAKDGMKVVTADALGAGSEDASQRVLALRDRLDQDADPIAAMAAVGGADLAAAAGFFARAAELGIVVLIDGPFAIVAGTIAERLAPGTLARAISARAPAPGPLASDKSEKGTEFFPPLPFREGYRGVGASEGVGALLALPILDAAAAIASQTTRRTRSFEQVVPIKRRKVAIFTGSFDPPTTFHRRVAMLLRERGFDEVIVRPNGPRGDTNELEHAAPIHRAVMVDLAFRDLPGVSVDLSDLDDGVFTPPVAFDDLYADYGEVWHVVSDEFVTGGRTGQSWIHTKWECGIDIWAAGRFIVLHPDNRAPEKADLPPACRLVEATGHVPTADIRTRIFQGGTAHPDVPPAVEDYIRRYALFSGMPSPRETRVRLTDLRLKFVFDERNEKARAFAERYRRYESDAPTHVLAIGGDGTMLQAIRDHWRLRLPFIGLNAGTLGFLMNESLPTELGGSELVLYRMPMLRVDTEAPDGKWSRALACGDAWVERESGQAAWLRVGIDGHTQVSKVVGDGLLIATPAGGSSYARAMGATPVPLTAPVLTLTGSNVFLPRFWRPVALPETAEVTLTSLNHRNEPGTNPKRPLRGFVDGRATGPVRSMNIRVSSVAAVELGFTPEFDLSSRLLRSMFPPEGM